jgi:two-component system CheB/CheR fusion protein
MINSRKKVVSKKKAVVPVKKKKVAVPKRHKATAKKAAKPEKKLSGPPKPFPVVGVGASAGGLEAFSILLEHLPANLGMAYVFIQHLSPTHESFLPDILNRKTKMKVHRVRNNMNVEKNNVYVIPSNHSIVITDGMLKLIPRPAGAKTFYPVDHFLTSLAEVYQQNAVGIILSGTGTDGTAGLRAIKAEGGVTFAQDDTAKYSGMPYNAAEMNSVDFVMPPDKIAQELATLILHPYNITTANEFITENKVSLKKILTLLHSRKDIDFSHYKQTTIQRRIMRRMLLNRLKSLKEYAQLLQESNTESEALYHDLLISVTNFFRDPGIYKALTNKILPAILKERRPGDVLRIWIPGCATGEEAISFAIVMLEYLKENAVSTPIQIFATDLNERAIEKSRAGIYSKTALQNVSPQRLRKYFVKLNSHYQVMKSIRDICIFATHNLLKDPPFSRMDIISCQNVLIYLETAPQNKIMRSFHYALKSTGYLLLGKSETIGSAIDIFAQQDKEYKIYTKKAVNTSIPLDFSMRNIVAGVGVIDQEEKRNKTIVELDLEKETEKLLLNKYMPASVLVNKDLEILRFRGTVAPYLEPAIGKASLHLMKMVNEEIAYELRSVILQAKKEGQPAKKDNLHISLNGNIKKLAIEVLPIKNNGKELYFLIVFKDENIIVTEEPDQPEIGDGDRKDKRIQQLEKQLKEARENIKVMGEEFEATREELQSANEEVLSSNEELQSINEELETSKEELQSANEELTTINEELQKRNTELKEASDYSHAILETMHESLLILTSDLRITTANKGFYNMFQLTPEETEGYNLYELDNYQWDTPALRSHLKKIQTGNLAFSSFEIELHSEKLGHKTMILNAEKLFIKDAHNSLILLAIQDITSLKEGEERFRMLIQNAFDIITIYDSEGTITYESPAIEAILGYTVKERLGKNIFSDPIAHPEDRKIKQGMLKNALEHPEENVRAEFRLRHKDGSYRTIDAICRNMIDDRRINGIIANYRDITERKLLEIQKDQFIGIVSHELKTPVTSIKAYSQILEDEFLQAGDKKSAALLSKLDGQVDKLSRLIIDLLDFTRIEGGKLKLREESYDINKLAVEVIEEMQRTSKTHKINKKLKGPAMVWGDRYRTGQVLTNLISNALKYSPRADKIIVKSYVENNNIVFCVQDFGIGISGDMRSRIFERFYRINDPSINSYPGLGLGLFISSEIVKQQCGKIWVESVKGKGATFYFSLPLNN